MALNITETKARRPAHNGADALHPERSARLGQPQPAEVQPAVIAGTRPPSSASAGDMVLAYLRVHAARLKSLEPAVRADEFDAVHQMRVATRRLRAALRSFGSVIPRPETEPVMAELRWLGTALGEARDDEVLSGHLQASLRSVPVELLIGPVSA